MSKNASTFVLTSSIFSCICPTAEPVTLPKSAPPPPELAPEPPEDLLGLAIMLSSSKPIVVFLSFSAALLAPFKLLASPFAPLVILATPVLIPEIFVPIESNLMPNSEPSHLIAEESLSINTLNTALI